MNNEPTDNLKILSRRTGLSVGALRDMARDLDIAVIYEPDRHTWALFANPTVVKEFCNHLAETLR